ncbi:MAG: hypothetical protein AAGB03_03645 [Pseudomonadota bacterium]
MRSADNWGTTSAACAPAVAFNFLGQLDAGRTADEAGFKRLAAPGTGNDPRNARAHLVDLDAHLEGDTLVMRWTYDERLHRQATITALADAWEAAWHELTTGVTAKNAATDDRFGLVDLDENDLNAVLASVRFDVPDDD